MDFLAPWALPLNVVVTMVLCVVAFALGVRRRQLREPHVATALHGGTRARQAVESLCQTTDKLWATLRRHRWRLGRFRDRLGNDERIDVQEVEVAVAMLRRLSSDLGLARLRVREQMDQLVALTESRVDVLTGVANRRAFDEELEMLVAKYQRTGQTFALALVDWDRFKEINATLGHPAADTLLRQAAHAITRTRSTSDFVARTGGDEFGILMHVDDLEVARRQVQELREAVQAVTKLAAGNQLELTVCTGVALQGRGDSVDSLVARADSELHRSKRATPRGAELPTTDVPSDDSNRLALERSTAAAPPRDQFNQDAVPSIAEAVRS